MPRYAEDEDAFQSRNGRTDLSQVAVKQALEKYLHRLLELSMTQSVNVTIMEAEHNGTNGDATFKFDIIDITEVPDDG